VAVRSHQWIDERSLALHQAVAAKLEAHPQLLDLARQNVERWLPQTSTGALREWRRILDSTPLSDVVALLRSSSEEATRLRQSSPFAGLLTTDERRAIMAAYESRRA
jgi:predicted NACHT family NTPase